MRWCKVFCFVPIFFPVLLHAGPIYGSIFSDGAALKQAVISVACGGRIVANGSTLDDGSYRVPVPQEGRCTLTVKSGSIQASAEIASYSGAAQYNFVVVKGSGGYALRRQ